MLRKGIIGRKEGRVLTLNKGRKKGNKGRKNVKEGMLNEVYTHTHPYIYT